jgi:hypothetical protein
MTHSRAEHVSREFLRYKQVTAFRIQHLLDQVEAYRAIDTIRRRSRQRDLFFVAVVGFCVGIVLTSYVLRSL